MSRAGTFIKLCLILSIIQSVSCDWKPNNKEKETLCKEAECKAKGEEYKKNLNAKIHPCQDFYTFTCGNWHSNHPGPKYAPAWVLLDVINFEFISIIRNTLESYNFQPGDNIMFRLAKNIYQTCVSIPEYPIKEAKDIAREVTKIGRVPKTPLWDIHSKYLQLSGESALFRAKIMGSKSSQDVPVLMLMEPSSAYGSIFHEEAWKPQEKQAYTEFLFLIMKSLKLKDSDAQLREKIEKVFEFRKKLDQIIERHKRTKCDGYKPFVGLALNRWFSETLQHQRTTQNIPWTEVIDALLPNVSSEIRRTRKIVAMRQKQYFLDLMALLKDTSEEVLAFHMEVHFVEGHLKLNDKLYKLLEGTSVEPHRLSRYIKEKYYPRWQMCIESHNMKEDLEKLLFHKWFQTNSAEIIRQMNGRIKIAIEEQVRKSNWLDESTREQTVKKLKEVKEWIGFPPWINGIGQPTVARNKNDILTPEASLALNFNLLYIHAPLMSPPIFSPSIPTVYNYAGMGTTVGHELYHIIDDCGIYETDKGNVVWWSPEMRAKCITKKALFIEAYNNVTDRDFKIRYNIDVKSDTSVSFLENYPDVMGLEAAYNAYKELAVKEKSVCQTLPNFEKYSCDQMFYIAFANSYCGFYTKKSAEKKLIEKSTHSLDSIRINGAVAQMKSFATAFGCPAGSPMNPETKVNLWH